MNLPCPFLLLVVLGKGQENPPKCFKARILAIPTEPQNPWKRRENTQNSLMNVAAPTHPRGEKILFMPATDYMSNGHDSPADPPSAHVALPPAYDIYIYIIYIYIYNFCFNAVGSISGPHLPRYWVNKWSKFDPLLGQKVVHI